MCRILIPWGISFHPVVVNGLGKDLFLKSILGRCERMYSINISSSKIEHDLRN